MRYLDVLYYDSVQSDIDEINKLNVVSVLVRNGMTLNDLVTGLRQFSAMRMPLTKPIIYHE